MPGLLNIHFAFPESFRNTFEIKKRVNCGNELWTAVKRKDTKVSKYYVVTEKHEMIIKKRKKYNSFHGDRTHRPKCLRLRIKCANHHAREDVTLFCELR